MTKSVELYCDTMPRATRYEFRYRRIGESTWSGIISSTSPVVTVTLEVGASYQYQWRTVCGTTTTDWATAGANIYSTEGSCITPAGILVEQIQNSYDFRVYWINTGVTGWSFRYRRQGDLTWITTTLSVPEVTFSSLIIGATYEYQVQSICPGSVVSDWGNIGTFDVVNATGTQACPFEYEDEFTGTLIGRKDTRNAINISGTVTYISADPLPAVGDFIIVGSVALCCAPTTDTVLPISAPGFTGELTITAAGQLNLYIAAYTGSPALNFTISAVTFLGSVGTCPPIGGGGSNQITGTLTYMCSSSGTQGSAQISITFPAPTPSAITLLIGLLENTRYIGSDIFTPPPGYTPFLPDGSKPYMINIPAGVTSFATAGQIIQKGYSDDGIHVWTCHGTRVITDMYIKVDSPSTYVANLTITNSGITMHNV